MFTKTRFVIALMFWGMHAVAACTGSSPNWVSTPDSASVTSCVGSAVSGDTIVVLAGSATWAARVHPTNKNLTIIGAGIGQTLITGAAFQLTACNNPCRISGFEFDAVTLDIIVEKSVGFRIDHNSIQPPTSPSIVYAACLFTYGIGTSPTEGVVDHNTFTNCQNVVYGEDTGTGGKWSWASPLGLGDSHAVYFEDNTEIHQNGGGGGNLDTSDSNLGGRIVNRFNHVTGGRFERHSLQADNGRGTRRWETYNNTMDNPAVHAYRPFFYRGGTGMVFHNTTDGLFLHEEFDMDNVRTDERAVVPCGADHVSAGWCAGTPGTPAASWCDSNTNAYGYMCRDQIGASDDASAWSYTFPAPVQAFQPAYLWRNTNPSGELPYQLSPPTCPMPPGDPSCLSVAQQIVNNRDYYTYAASFDGTTGVGEGNIAARPPTCTAGVGYWAQDLGFWNQKTPHTPSGELFTCTSTNVWSLTYTPYTYPHTLEQATNPMIPNVIHGRLLRLARVATSTSSNTPTNAVPSAVVLAKAN